MASDRTNWVARLVAAVATALCFSLSAVAFADNGVDRIRVDADPADYDPRVPRIKAAFILNFLKFTEFRKKNAIAQRLVCVLCPDEFSLVRDTLQGKEIGDGRSIRIVDGKDPRDCDVVYRCRTSASQYESAGVLVITSSGDVCADGAHISLYQEKGKMRFAVDVKHIERDQVAVSSKVLSLAKIAECSYD